MITKLCLKCNIEKPKTVEYFSFRIRGGSSYFESPCKDCQNLNKKNFYQNNKIVFQKKRKEHYKKNKVLINLKNNEYKNNHKNEIIEYQKQYYIDNEKELKLYFKLYKKNRKIIDIIFKIKENISSLIRMALKRQINNKKESVSYAIKYLSYSLKLLKQYIESLFEPWMNWNNWGVYNKKTWDDNNSSTWTWNIDHIIPQSDLPYDSMDHSNFKKCWSLENLRPYSAKQNILDGTSRIRHISKKVKV